MRLTVRVATVDDDKVVREIHEKAFGQPQEANLVEAISRSSAFVKELSLLAETDEEVVGHVLYSAVRIDKFPRKRFLALAPVAVLPEYQNKGIGSRLIHSGNEIADQLKYELITVLGEPQYYHRFGFEPSTNYGIKCPFDVEPDYYMVLLLSQFKKGTNGMVIYPDAFQNV